MASKAKRHNAGELVSQPAVAAVAAPAVAAAPAPAVVEEAAPAPAVAATGQREKRKRKFNSKYQDGV